MENKLTVRNLRVSFRTSNGKVQAVRGINFDLIKGETLAIVGESGSGKSVTSKAILGILAGNAIVESGEILYDGRDLLKISEASRASADMSVAFQVLNKIPEKQRGMGAVVCLCPQPGQLRENVLQIPAWYI